MQTINLISDTVTRPTAAMMEAMMNAEVGDDVFGQDPSINALEQYAAELFGKEKALFCPSGTMTNQIAIKLHTSPLDEVVCDKTAHIYNYEAGAWAMHSGVSIQLLDGKHGIINAGQVESAIQPHYDWLPRTRLVAIENTCNKAGGTYYTTQDIRPISELCSKKGLAMHLDGARLFNALVETEDSPKEYGELFDTISICLSKGLGAPVGSLLLGSEKDMALARRYRKALGGGMRQAGYLAAAGQYALENHVERLKEDHQKAATLAESLSSKPFVTNIRPVKTNILIFDLSKQWGNADKFIDLLKKEGILCVAFGLQTIRMVTHLDVSYEDIEKTVKYINEM